MAAISEKRNDFFCLQTTSKYLMNLKGPIPAILQAFTIIKLYPVNTILSLLALGCFTQQQSFGSNRQKSATLS